MMMPLWLQNIDAAVFLFFNRAVANPVFDVVMPFITEADHWKVPIALGVLALAVFGGKKGRITVLLMVIVVTIGDQLAASVLKPLVGRIRPCFALESARLIIKQSNSFSFPSAHATNNAAMAALIWLRYPRVKWVFVTLAMAVAYSRIYVGVHYPVDVLFGLALGTAVGVGVVRGWEGLSTWRNAR